MSIQVDLTRSKTVQAFQLSRFLHHLTNIISSHLKKNNLVLYYDIDKEISRYLVAEFKPLKETLEELMLFFYKVYNPWRNHPLH